MSAAIDVVRTSVFSALNGARAGNRDVAIIFLHGASADMAATMRSASAARRDGVTLLAVGVTANVRVRELDAIASYPMMSNVFRIPNYFSFVNIQGGLTTAVCNGLFWRDYSRLVCLRNAMLTRVNIGVARIFAAGVHCILASTPDDLFCAH